MSRWFRHYAGMVRDDKLVRASIKSKQSIERVVWIWGAVLESAAEIDDDARYEVDADEIARFLRCKAGVVKNVLDALIDLGRIDGERVTAWSKRQFKSDRSNERVAAHRNKKRSDGNGDVTLQVTLPQRDGNSPETETETEVTLAKANGVVSLFPDTPQRSPATDSDSEFWSSAKAYLADETKNPGALIGKWSRDNTKQTTAQAITRAQLERPVQKIPFIEGCFRQMKQTASAQPAVPL